jgi:hypothetical protein
MRRKQRGAHARDCLIRTAIGRMLAAQYDLSEPLSERLETLLRRFENTDDIGAAETPLVQCGSSRRAGARAKPELAST